MKNDFSPAAAEYLLPLDALRGFAATYVLLFHAKIIPLFGQEAVILFFLMSGFLIYYVTHSSADRPSAALYLYHRARRIYPIYLFSLLAAYISACLIAGTVQEPRWFNLIENISMFQV